MPVIRDKNNLYVKSVQGSEEEHILVQIHLIAN